MKREFLLISLILSIHILNVQSESLSLIGSRFITNHQNATVFLSAKEFDGNSDVKVSFKAGEDLIDLTTYSSLDGDKFESISIPISNYPDHDSYELTLSHTSLVDKITNKRSIKLFNPLHHPLIFIQTDKTVYDIGDTINFRVFVLNQNFVPINYKKLEVIVKDANNRKIQNYINSKQTTFGVYKNSLKISQNPNLGKWSIEVEVNGKKKLKNFVVQQNLGIQMSLKCSKNVAYSDQILQMYLNIEKDKNKSFSGSAKIKVVASLADNKRVVIDKHVKSVNVVNGNNILAIDFERELGLSSLSYDYILDFTVKVTEDDARTGSMVSSTVNLRKESRLIEVNRSKYFRPGFKFVVEIFVKTFNGRLDQSYEDLQVEIKYLSESGRAIETKRIRKRVFDGKVELELESTVEAKKIQLKLKYKTTEKTEKIDAIPIEGNVYLEITGNIENKTVGEDVHLTAKTTVDEMSSLHVMVIGPNGLIYHKEYPEAERKDMFQFTVKITEKMTPISNIIAYYFKSNGDVVYDGYKMDIGSSIPNTLSIRTASTAKTNDNVDIKITSENGTRVFLAAVSGNADGNKDIKDFLKNRSNMMMKFRDRSAYDFAQFNAFILEPLKSEKNLQKDETEDFATSLVDTTMDMIFSNVWFFEDIAGQDITTLKKRIPELQATWQIYGFSMHPSKGLSLSETTPTITVKLDLATTIYAPEWIYKDEIVKIEYDIFNYLSTPINANVTVSIKNGRILNTNIVGRCYNESENAVERNELITIEAESESKFNALFIKGVSNKPIEVSIEVRHQMYSSRKNKIINVIASSESESVDVKPNDDVLKNAMMLLDKTLSIPMVLNDYKAYKFAASLIKYQYLTGENLNESRKMLEKSYADVLPVLKDLTNTSRNSNLKLVSYITETLINAQELINVDEDVIKNSLKYIKSKQHSNGSFLHLPEFDSRRAIGSPNFQTVIQDALVILPFLKYNKLNSKHQDFIDKTMKRLNNSKTFNDYEKVIVANALMLYSNETVLNSFNIQNKYKTAIYPKHKSMLMEVVSYLINLKSEFPKEELEWLINQIKLHNRFYSPYDAILATKALHEVSIRHKENLNDIKPNIPNLNETTDVNFDLTVKITELNDILEINITVSYVVPPKNPDKTNLVVIETMMPSGYKYISYKHKNVVKQADVHNDGRLVLIYVDQMEMGHKQMYKIKAEKQFDVFKTANSTVKVYDYYRSNIFNQTKLELDVNENKCRKLKFSGETEYTDI